MVWTEYVGAVRLTKELRRVMALPWDEPFDMGEDELRAYARELGSRSCGRKSCRYDPCPIVFRPQQGEVLDTLARCRGCFATIPVGEGKTLPSFLAGRALGVDSQESMVLVPGELREKTQRDFVEAWRHFGGTFPPVISYEEISRFGDKIFEDFQPKVVVADECHRLKNWTAGCTKKLYRYLLHPTRRTALLAMSGTVIDRSLLDFWHLLFAAIPEGMPLPETRTETALWGRAVDEKVEVRSNPGALCFLANKDTVSISEARKAVHNRIFSTAGCVLQKTSSVKASLIIEVKHQRMPTEAKVVWDKIRKEKIDPIGDECTPADIWRYTRMLALGFIKIWVEPGPEEWMKRRRAWKAQVRETLEAMYPGLDTDLDVVNAARNGRIDPRRYQRWVEIKDTFKPKSRPIWYSDAVLDRIIGDTPKGALVWVSYPAVGERIAKLTGWPFYHSKGRDSRGRFIEDHPKGQTAIAALHANKRGRNLQYTFHQNVVTTVEPKGIDWEQFLGRTHRSGQEEDEVRAIVWAGYQTQDLEQARRDATFQDELNRQPRKLLLADWIE